MGDASAQRPGSSLERAVSYSSADFDLMDEMLSGDCWFQTNIPFLDTQENETLEQGSGQKLNLLIQPRSPIPPLKDRLIHALRRIKEAQRDSDVLVQIWVPICKGGKHFLSTFDQPFWLDTNCQSLVSYRSVSASYEFSAEENSDEVLGLPGRVFLGKVPEWTPDVRCFSSSEFPRVDRARTCNVRGTIAMPVFERDSRSCLGVVEVVLTTQKINYSSDIESICSALQAVDLRTSDVLSVPRLKVSENSYQAALPEIQEVLRVVCDTHNLPLAQTWIKCIQQNKQGSRHSNENYKDCVSTVDSACYVNYLSMLSFHEACSEHHLFIGQGVVGKAFTTNQPCFYPNVTNFIKTQYPLSHHARLFNLRAAVAIRLRSVQTGRADFVLEFFLPVDCIESEEQKLMLNSLSTTIQKVCKSLRVVTDKELENEAMLTDSVATPSIPLEFGEDIKEFSAATNWDASETGHLRRTDDQKDSFCGDPWFPQSVKTTEKRRAKSEKTVSLQVLRQYFSGSLKDAAKSLGVCPTTLKRICRQHGITRWPSRKIKKVGHSLKKLQVVIDSVQGAEGTFQFSSVYENFAKISRPDKLSSGKRTDHPESSNTLRNQDDTRLGSRTSSSNSLSCSSCSQSSNSNSGCHAPKLGVKQEASQDENQMAKLKRENSEVKLQVSVIQDPPRPPVQLQKRSDVLKVKAAYGGENIRFRLKPSWGFRELKQEVLKMFNIDDLCPVDLKYLDDDSEWVLLTCDADLQECIDVYKSSSCGTIKMSVHRVAARMASLSIPQLH